jgi:hypothetical protein
MEIHTHRRICIQMMISIFTECESSFNGTWKYAGYHFYHLDINDFDIKCHSQRALSASTAIGLTEIYHHTSSVQMIGVANVSDQPS